MKEQLISIETTRYAEFFRYLLQEYISGSSVTIDGRTIEESGFPQLIEGWCVNERIKQTRNFTLSRNKTELFGFHDSPKELWASITELPFVERMAANKLVRFKVLKAE